MLNVIRKLSNIFRSIFVTVFESVVHHIITDIVGLPQLVTLYNPDVNCMSDRLVAVILVTA